MPRTGRSSGLGRYASGEGVMRPGPGDGEGQPSPSAHRRESRRQRPRPADLPDPGRREAAMKVAVRLLGVRERSQAELRQHLGRRGFDRETIQQTIARLTEGGLQDDRRFAVQFAAEAAERTGLAGVEVRRRLGARGVSADLAAEASTATPDEEEARARAGAAKRARALSWLPQATRHRRLAAYLARRGYPLELCERLAAEQSEPTDEGPPASTS